MATLKKELKDILNKYGIDPQDKNKLWDCHGTLVLYHKAYEIIAAQENIKFDAPVMLETNSQERIVALVVTGHMGERSEWSFGETSPANLKSTYPYAMAEKRAKDRVIAKLVGLAQYVYSEDEAEEFKVDKQPVREDAPQEETNPFTPENKALQATIITKIALCKDETEISSLLEEYDSLVSNLPGVMQGDINNQLSVRREQISKGVNPAVNSHKFGSVDDAIKWAMEMKPIIEGFKTIKQMDQWETYHRPWINGLECLKAQKYMKDGKTPKERFLDSLMLKRVQLEATPIG